MDGVRGLALFQGPHTVVQIQITEENHIVHHKTEEGSQFVLRWQHKLLSLTVDYRVDLVLDLASLLEYEVGPRELLLDALI